MGRSLLASILVISSLTLSLAFARIGQFLIGDTATSRAASSADTRTETFDWFGTLGFPDVKGLKFLRIATGGANYGNGTPQYVFVHGFLLKEDGASFTALTLSLEKETYQKSPAKTPHDAEVGYEAADLAVDAAAFLKDLCLPPGAEQKDSKRQWETHHHNRTDTFVLAWACWRNGLEKLSEELYNHASKMSEGRGDNPERPPTQSLRQMVAADLAHLEMWRAIIAFGDAAITRTELLKQLEQFEKNYPDNKHQERAKDSISLLQQMVKEDREHAQKDRKPFEQLSKKEQAAELIFQLRDQNGHQFTQPGYCDIFLTSNLKDDTPAHRLVKLGYDAVPQLIEAIEDPRFTRSVGFQRSFFFSHYVLRVGDCALTILERITGRSLWPGTSTFSYLTKDRKTGEAKKKVEAWYEEFQKKGEKRMLIEAVERGDRDSHDQARLLVERYPDEALPALKAGIKAARNSSSRDLLVASVARMKGDGPLPLLLAEVKDGPYSYGRLVTAQSLHLRGRPEGVAAMIAEWQGERPRQQPEAGVKRDEVEEPDAGLPSVAQFLATCGEIKAIAALEKGLRNRPVGLRLSVVSSFRDRGNLSTLSTIGGGIIQPGEKPVRDNPKEVRTAIERLLIGALDDTEERSGMSGSWNGKNFTDPRICDAAGHVLNQLAPDRYPFDLGAPLAKRDQAIVVLKNEWRRAHGLAPLPAPAVKVIAPVRDERLQPLVDKLLQSPPALRPKAMAEIEALGLGALPGIQNRLAKATKNGAPELGTLEKLARRVSCIIDEATLTEDSLKPDAVVGKLKNMHGKPFEPESFMELVRSLVKDLPKGVQALRFSVDRAGDGAGVTLKVDLLDEPRARQLGRSGSISGDPTAPQRTLRGWNFSELVEVDKGTLHTSSGGCTHAYWLEDKHAYIVGAITDACSSTPAAPFVIRILLVADLGK